MQDIREDGTVALRPDTSIQAIEAHLGGRAATPEEFDTRSTIFPLARPSHQPPMPTLLSRRWPVRFDTLAWDTDLHAATQTARRR